MLPDRGGPAPARADGGRRAEPGQFSAIATVSEHAIAEGIQILARVIAGL